uniref:SGNH hydrolase-type esterase domain-containing protein n=1 Tax=Calcidiscus leptoporus TaxID=127549 RepID=A0A7S0IPL4_9EUKA|mmetsp:Transcript_155/g.337  ORF Transcript_155/g.337 Transcript_155/m.337 type:complete len:612 (+) Transcript_155:34-1869(+)
MAGSLQYVRTGAFLVNTLLLLLLLWLHGWSGASARSATLAHHAATAPPRNVLAAHDASLRASAERIEAAVRLLSRGKHAELHDNGASTELAAAARGGDAIARRVRHALTERRLKHIWRMPKQHPGTRAAAVEVHNDTWALLSERQIARGLASAGDPLRMECLATKLLSGAPVRLAVIGGSVSFGTTFTTSRSRALFHWKVYQWLNATFPGVTHEHYSGAVPASGPSYMEHCVHWHVDPHADLVLLEYAVNFEPGGDDAAAFERLLRKLLAMPNRPAVVILNPMELMPADGKRIHFTGPKQFNDGYSAGPVDEEDMGFQYAAAAEDAINALAQYYGVPCVSLRNALFTELKARSAAFPLKLVFHDRHHPGAWGHSLLAQMVVHRLSQAVMAVLDEEAHSHSYRRVSSPQCEQLAADSWSASLGAPLISKVAEAEVGMCIKEEGLKSLMADARGFEYRVEGSDAKMKPGLIGMHPGDHVLLCVDVSRAPRGGDFVVILGHLISYEHMGIASIECVGDCECKSTQVDAHVQGGKFSVFKARTIHMMRPAKAAEQRLASQKPGCGCALRLSILKETSSGEHKFKVLSLMSAVHEGSIRYGHQTGFNVRPMGARTS